MIVLVINQDHSIGQTDGMDTFYPAEFENGYKISTFIFLNFYTFPHYG
jgi:hypothetical protein